ncbi:methyltransferase domain-containing protein [Streptomyces sp. ZYX-F-203]
MTPEPFAHASTSPSRSVPAERHRMASRQEIDRIEQDVLYRRSVERYLLARQYAHGTVLDCACGSGYGSYLMAKNPDVGHVHGYDRDPDVIEPARLHLGSERVSFWQADLEEVDRPADLLVCLETIEHLDDPMAVSRLADRCGVHEIVVSFPTKKTTHYNPHHRWDLVEQDVRDILSGFHVHHSHHLFQDTRMMWLARGRGRAESPPTRWGPPFS